MVDSNYMMNRKRYARPQAMLFSNNPGYIENDLLVPDGQELIDFIVLSDDNRESINVSYERIENRVRTINGRMRSYHVADKLKIDVSWSLLPSRSFAKEVAFSESGTAQIPSEGSRPVRDSGSPTFPDESFTTDRGAGGVELLDWYEKNTSSFWVFLSYDNYKNFETNQKTRLNQYSDVVEMFFSNFQYSVEKRGGQNFDYWNISLSLEEV